MSRRLRFPKDMREGDDRLVYGMTVEAVKYGEWITAKVEGRIVDTVPGQEERIRLSDESGGHFYGYPSTVRRVGEDQ